jgi:drug/metabolite transporter (DMT)-like permease
MKVDLKSDADHHKAVLQALLVTFLWSTSWVFIKIGLVEIRPLSFAGLRYGLAFLCMLPIFVRRRQYRQLSGLPRNTWGLLALLGIIYYAATQGAQFVALAYLPAVSVNLILTFTTIIVALSGMVFLAERPTARQWLGILIAIGGAVVYFYPVSLPEGVAIGLIAGGVAVVANSVSSVLGRRVNSDPRLSPLTVTVVSMGIGSLLLAVVGLSIEGLPPVTFRNVLIITWLAVVNTAFAFTLWNHTLQTLDAFESSVINNTMMIQIPILAIIFLGERLTASEFAGLGIAILGTLLVQFSRRRKQRDNVNKMAVGASD